jgi:TonB family protein
MHSSSRSVGVAILIAALLTARPARAECIAGGAWWLDSNQVELVFGGTVVEIVRTAEVGYRATFDVDRVWKGTVLRRFNLHVWELASEVPRIRVGARYVIGASTLGARAREGAGLGGTEPVAFGPVQCGALSQTEAESLGPGRPPTEMAVRNPPVVMPRKVKDAAPAYTPAMLFRSVRGVVILQILVDEAGRVTNPTILRSIPLFDQAAIDCVMKWEYAPATMYGTPIPVTMTVTVTFDR